MADADLSIMETPQCLVSTDENGDLIVKDDILQELKKLSKPLVIVAIVGLYRTGKSFLMNRFAGKSPGFPLGSEVKAITKGIWIWVLLHPQEEDKYLVLLDTEGLGATQREDANFDTWIFCLATLLSSVLVYNAIGSINDDALGKLDFITEMSKHIKTKIKSSGDQNFDHYFPDFIYVVRDFTLDLKNDGKTINEDEYLEQCLGPVVLKKESNNRTGECLRRYFKNRKCFTFDRPGDRRTLRELDNVSCSELSPDFIDDCSKFRDHILYKGSVKVLDDGQKVDGNILSHLVTNYVESIRNGDIPCIENAIVAMATIENGKAIDASVAFYHTNMTEKANFPTPDKETLDSLHEDVRQETMDLFLSKAVCDTGNKFQKKLETLIADLYEKVQKENQLASTNKCIQTLETLEQEIMKAKELNGSYYRSGGFEEFDADLQEIFDKYLAKDGLGVKKDEMFQEYKAKKNAVGKTIEAADKNFTEKERFIKDKCNNKIAEAEHRRDMAEKEALRVKEFAEQKEKAVQESTKKLEESYRGQLNEKEKLHQELITSKLSEQKKILEEGFERENDKLRRQLKQATMCSCLGCSRYK